MNYVRTSAGGMMPISFKTNGLNTDKKQTSVSKPSRKLKKNLQTRPK
ncbi:MAG: hypothetical protein ABGY08_12905 [Gammaproteobacteria bacterium]|jgi:hypothetical protein